MAGIRTTRLKVTISEKDATEQVENDLLSFSYTDKEADEAEEVSITLKDEKGKWRTSWAPDPNAKLTASITSLLDGVVIGELPCGQFHVDSRRVAGAPSVYELRATSGSPIRRKVKERTFKQQTVRQIAQTIASDNSLTLYWDCADDVGSEPREQADQKRESDLVFLQKLCKEEGANLKLSDSKLIIFDQKSYEKKSPVATITLGSSNVLRWEFSQEMHDAYKSVTVTYRDPAKKVKGRAAQKTKKKSTSSGSFWS